jgi:hypothetical protein
MSAPEVYQEVERLLATHIDLKKVDPSTLNRLVLVVLGILDGKSASPARIASALKTMGLQNAETDSIERQIRRFENDPEVSAALCFHPLARIRLLWGRPHRLYLILDPTLQEDRVVMVSIAVWYRGRALPLAWAIWGANRPLEGDRFWERIETLLDQVKAILPSDCEIVWFADRAFGTPAFIDLLVKRNWHYVIRVQGQTHYRDRKGREGSIQSLVRPGKRAKLSGEVFKKASWRPNSVVAYWGKAYRSPMCLVSDLPAEWDLLALYRRRYPIEASFRDYKSYGWHWEQGQVANLEHLERLLVAMAIAAWVALLVGTRTAEEVLKRYEHSTRRTIPYEGKRSLFQLGLQRLGAWFKGAPTPPLNWDLTHLADLNWEDQLYFFVARRHVFA